jgi:hypothetical protein
MTVEQIIEQIDRNIKVLNESLQVSTLLHTTQVKKNYGSIKTYNECVSMERGALTSMINFRQWIVNNKHK